MPELAIPHGFCHCGCGEETKLAVQTREKYGHVKGEPMRFPRGHATRLKEPRPREERFWAKVDRQGPDDCWLWQAGSMPQGYGNFFYNPGTLGAHVFAYETLVGPVLDGLELDHLCRNPACVNPAHLEPVTHRENCLRGISPAAFHAKKTHCPKGHPYSEHPGNPNWRICRQCHRESAKRQVERRKANGK